MSSFEDVLNKIRPGVGWSNVDGSLANVRWQDGIAPPTQLEFDAAKAEIAPSPGITVSSLRFRLELYDRGLLDEVVQAVSDAGEVAQLYWNAATEIESDHFMVTAIAATIGLSQRELASIFDAARDRKA